MDKNTLRLGLGQINATVGDLDGNVEKVCNYIQQADSQRADIVCFPELVLTGYPPEDLLLKPTFIRDNLKALHRVVHFSSKTPRLVCVVGFVDQKDGKIFNAAGIIQAGRLLGVYHKILLPNYGVFDEKRYFTPGQRPLVLDLKKVRVGVNICEDIWSDEGPTGRQVAAGAQLILNISSSPYHLQKWRERAAILKRRSLDHKVFIAYLNLVGGQDELVFDGHSLVYNDRGEVLARCRAFEEEMAVFDIELPAREKRPKGLPGVDRVTAKAVRTGGNETGALQPALAPVLSATEEIYRALVLGTRDYIRKNGFTDVVVGLSGGVDSALTSVVAGDAIGTRNVHLVFMPSRFSSPVSLRDAQELADNLGIPLMSLNIEPMFREYLKVLKPAFKGAGWDIAEENLQARIRGSLLMALSNKFGWLVLTTGNKSEMSMGYATLYGDMAGGFAVLKDVLKEKVYSLCRTRNLAAGFYLIPEHIISRTPTAELRKNQKDSDSLPPYPVLDPILKKYVEKDESLERIAGSGFSRAVVRQVIGMVDKSEYKRRQAPPGVKITPKAFGRDRRMPLTNHYEGYES